MDMCFPLDKDDVQQTIEKDVFQRVKEDDWSNTMCHFDRIMTIRQEDVMTIWTDFGVRSNHSYPNGYPNGRLQTRAVSIPVNAEVEYFLHVWLSHFCSICHCLPMRWGYYEAHDSTVMTHCLSTNCMYDDKIFFQNIIVWENLEEHFFFDQKKIIADNKIDIKSWIGQMRDIRNYRLKCRLRLENAPPPLNFPFNLPKLLVAEDFVMTTDDALSSGFGVENGADGKRFLAWKKKHLQENHRQCLCGIVCAHSFDKHKKDCLMCFWWFRIHARSSAMSKWHTVFVKEGIAKIWLESLGLRLVNA
jgi:hypothetical protein